MESERIEALDEATKLSVVAVECAAAAAQLARGHLSGPAAAVYLAESLAGAALLGAETSRENETVTFRLDVPGAPLGGFLVEATAEGTLRGYTKKKIIDDLDGMGAPKDKDALGASGTFEVIRSVPGTVLSSGAVAVKFAGKGGYVAQGLDAYFAQSLQRRVKTALAGAAGDDGVPTVARGLMVECPPDGDAAAFAAVLESFASGAAAKAVSGVSFSMRTVLKKIGLPHAEVRARKPLSFACRCSAERAEAILAAIPPEERKSLPEAVDITCHMCGRTWTVGSGK